MGRYLSDSMVNCVLKHFLHTVEDGEVKPIIEFALGLTTEHMEFKNKLFKDEEFPIPLAFTEKDVNLNAPRLFSDGFMLLYLRHMGIAGTSYLWNGISKQFETGYSCILSTQSERLRLSCWRNLRLYLQSKGILTRSPFITVSEFS